MAYKKTITWQSTVTIFEEGDIVKPNSESSLAFGHYTVVKCYEPDSSNDGALVLLRDDDGNEKTQWGSFICDFDYRLDLVRDTNAGAQ